ncbi:hypothetical protein BY458DRAFT_517804 [Sporodiniella umbellata]|nr:hypothetical protein BY458DRAFT_517804 [Sporodiniella umbellata]
MYKRQNADQVSKWAKPVQAVPKTIQEGPQNTWQLCYLYRVTFDKLQSSPSMYRAVHLKNTMETLQERRRMEQEEDNLPLAFIEKRPSPQLTLSNKHLVQA